MAIAQTFELAFFRSGFRSAAIAAASALAAVMGIFGATATPAAAQSIIGSWSGGGMIIFPSGETERARCRATFRNLSGGSVSMQGVCATASVRVSQSASLSRLTSTTYSGEFYNTEFNLSGSIRIRMQGSKLNASLSGGGATAQFVLGR
jgi:hypothetical protein